MSSKDKIIKYNDFIPEKLTFTKMEENDKIPNNQMIAYPRYLLNGVETSQFNIQFPWIDIISYGVPKANQYFKSDAERSKVKLPLNSENSELTDLIAMIHNIDKHVGSPEILAKIIGKKSKKYKYLTSFKDPSLIVEDEDDEDEKKPKKTTNYIKYPYITLKMALTYPDKQFKTELFETELSPDKQKTINRELVNYTTIDEFSEKVCYKSRVRPIVKPYKIWAHSASKKDPECGITWRIERIEVDKDSITINSAENSDSKKFIDSDSEEELPQIKVHPTEEVSVQKLEPIIKKTEPVKKKKVEESESDSESETINKKKVDSDSETESEDDKQYATKQKQIAEVDSDDSDEEEVVAKPPPPPVVATKSKKTAKTKSK